MLPAVETDEEWDAVVEDEKLMRAGAEHLCTRPAPRSLLHTEVMRQHFLVDPDGWRLTGLFDFEPAMIGDAAYDFVGVGVFVTRGDPHLLNRLTTAYGGPVDPSQALACTLLHVYSNLPWYLRELRAPAEGTLSALAHAWFGGADPGA